MDNLLLYTLGQPEVSHWELEPQQTYVLSDDLIDGDIYFADLNGEVKLKPLPNRNIEITPPAKGTQLTIVNQHTNWQVEGPLCSLNDLWLEVGSSAMVISSQELDLTLANSHDYRYLYSENLVYHVQPNAVANSNQSLTEAEIDEDDENLTTNEWDDRDEFDDDDEEHELDSEPTLTEFNGNEEENDSGLVNEFANIVSQAQQTKKSKFAAFFKRLAPLLAPVKRSFKRSKIARWGVQAYLRIREWARKNVLIASIVMAGVLMAISTIIVLIINNIQDNRLSQTQTSYYEKLSGQEQLINKLTKSLPIVNLNVYREYNRFNISGLILANSNYNPTLAQLKDGLAGIPYNLNIITLDQLSKNLLEIQQRNNLSCQIHPYDSVSCLGMVRDKDSAKEAILGQYKYNMIIPLTVVLLNKKDVINYLNEMFADKDSFANLSYALADNSLNLNGYIAQAKLPILATQMQQISAHLPFLAIKNNIRTIEEVIKLRVKQIVFNNYGNTLIDSDGNEYNVGSKYNEFTIVSIQKNSVMFHTTNNNLVLPTPFATDNFTTNDSLAQTSANDNKTPHSNGSNFMDKVFQSMNSIPLHSNGQPLDRKGIINEEINKQIADVNKKQSILDELTKAQRSNTNSSLKHAYDDLISNLKSDIAAQQQEIKAVRH